MKIFQILSLVAICWHLASSELWLNQDNSLLCCKIMSTNEISLFSFAFLYQENRNYPCKMNTSATLQQLLLIISGMVELNPGPSSKLKYPCGECRKAVSSGASIACDICNKWFHQKCTSMSDQIYECHVKEESLSLIHI